MNQASIVDAGCRVRTKYKKRKSKEDSEWHLTKRSPSRIKPRRKKKKFGKQQERNIEQAIQDAIDKVMNSTVDTESDDSDVELLSESPSSSINSTPIKSPDTTITEIDSSTNGTPLKSLTKSEKTPIIHVTKNYNYVTNKQIVTSSNNSNVTTTSSTSSAKHSHSSSNKSHPSGSTSSAGNTNQQKSASSVKPPNLLQSATLDKKIGHSISPTKLSMGTVNSSMLNSSLMQNLIAETTTFKNGKI